MFEEWDPTTVASAMSNTCMKARPGHAQPPFLPLFPPVPSFLQENDASVEPQSEQWFIFLGLYFQQVGDEGSSGGHGGGYPLLDLNGISLLNSSSVEYR